MLWPCREPCVIPLRECSKCGMRDNRGMYQGGPRRYLAFYKVEGELKKKNQAHIESKAENFQPSHLPKPSLYLVPMF